MDDVLRLMMVQWVSIFARFTHAHVSCFSLQFGMELYYLIDRRPLVCRFFFFIFSSPRVSCLVSLVSSFPSFVFFLSRCTFLFAEPSSFFFLFFFTCSPRGPVGFESSSCYNLLLYGTYYTYNRTEVCSTTVVVVVSSSSIADSIINSLYV